jgi:flagellar L-ring protein precursor FlgH
MKQGAFSQLTVGTLIILLAGCATTPEPRPGDARYSPVVPISQPAGQPATGSIYANGAGISLWEDKRARRIGDVITLYLDERTVSSKSNKTAIDKEDKLDMGVESLMGTQPSAKLRGSTLNMDVQTDNSREFEGDANSDQSNRLQGQITVTVADVLSNGVLVVRGEKWMTFSQGDEFIRIEGLLRQADVAPDNTALSTRLADARITYSGTGALANAQRQGWASRFFNTSWWPF